MFSSAQPAALPHASRFIPVEGKTIGDTEVRILGPVRQWGADVEVNAAHQGSLRQVLGEVAGVLNQPLLGYLIEEGERTRFHFSRIPRRAGEPLAPSEPLFTAAYAVAERLALIDPSVTLKEEQHTQESHLRAVFGLREGYSDPAMTTTHTLEDVARLLPSASLRSAHIYASYPGNEHYEEPAVRINLPDTVAAVRDLVAAARSLFQARFSVERFPDGECGNVELLRYSQNPSATVRIFHAMHAEELSLASIKDLLLGPEKPSIAFERAYREGRLTEMPELVALRGIPQDPDWHPEGDAWIHTLMVLDEAQRLAAPLREEERFPLMLAALAHDFGKAHATDFHDDHWRSHGHESAGVEPARAFVRRFQLDSFTELIVLGVVEHHMDPVRFYKELQKGQLNEASYAKAVNRLLRKLAPASPQIFIAAVEADQRGRGTIEAKAAEFPWKDAFVAALVQGATKSVAARKQPLLSGNDLIAHQIISPGPAMGALLKELSAHELAGEIRTKEDALRLARTLTSGGAS